MNEVHDDWYMAKLRYMAQPFCGGALMIIALGVIAVLILASVVILQRFMKDMAVVEKELLKEIKEMKQCLIRINEKQL